MSAQREMDEAAIRQRIDRLVEAVRAMDLEGVKSIYAPDVVTFDIVAPLRKAGAPEKWKNWAEVFAAYRPPLGYEVRELVLEAGGGVAFARSLNRISGTLQNGSRADYWVRWTAGFRKTGGQWLIAHDHVSVPIDVAGGRALLDLEP